MQEARDFLKTRQPLNLAVVVINLLVFVVLSILGDTTSGYFMLWHGAGYTPLIVEQGEYYRLFTSMFLHFGVQHLFHNMLVLIFLGDTLEQLGGKFCYVLIYFVGGLAGNVLSVAYDLHTGSYAVSAGASGAIFAVIGALVAVVVMNKGKIPGYDGRRVLMMAALSVLEGFSNTGVDNCAHIGGMAAGFVLAFLFYKRLKSDDRIPIEDYMIQGTKGQGSAACRRNPDFGDRNNMRK